MSSWIFLWQPQTEEVKKELTDRDVQAGFHITLTKHKGQVQVIPKMLTLMWTFMLTEISCQHKAFPFLVFLYKLSQCLHVFPLFLQYALRKLYHESPRLICVLFTAPTCGPCRTLKPILSKVHSLKLVLLLHYSSISMLA